MIVLVAPDGTALPDPVARSLRDRPVVRAASVDAAAARLDADGDVVCVVIDVAAVEGSRALVRRVRDGEVGDPAVPFVLVTNTDPRDLPLRRYDAVVTPEAETAPGLDRALRVGAYRTAVTDLYETCRDRAAGEAVDVDAARDDADRTLDALAEDPALVSAFLRRPDGADRD
ncbi:MAG: hypothetical protein ABEJ70_01475 [Halobacteriaceae archaeon]